MPSCPQPREILATLNQECRATWFGNNMMGNACTIKKHFIFLENGILFIRHFDKSGQPDEIWDQDMNDWTMWQSGC